MSQTITTRPWLILLLALVLQGCATGPQETPFLDIFDRAEADYRQGLLSRAEAGYRKVVQAKPTFYEPWLRLGNIYVRTGQYEAAILMFQECTRIQPNDVRGWNNLALTRVSQGIEVLDNASEHFPIERSERVLLKSTREKLVSASQ
ncbi:MAG: tetratricopeptide repeat protein [Oleiphilaceae bacterium]|nr:tetratricopeptide repeat protein [Oleiphilaceae bacterium]